MTVCVLIPLPYRYKLRQVESLSCLLKADSAVTAAGSLSAAQGPVSRSNISAPNNQLRASRAPWGDRKFETKPAWIPAGEKGQDLLLSQYGSTHTSGNIMLAR